MGNRPSWHVGWIETKVDASIEINIDVTNHKNKYVICIKSEDYPASLESRKIYKIIPDQAASKVGMVRVIDESGEDYLYPQEYFVEIKLPRAVEKAVQLAS